MDSASVFTGFVMCAAIGYAIGELLHKPKLDKLSDEFRKIGRKLDSCEHRLQASEEARTDLLNRYKQSIAALTKEKEELKVKMQDEAREKIKRAEDRIPPRFIPNNPHIDYMIRTEDDDGESLYCEDFKGRPRGGIIICSDDGCECVDFNKPEK